VFQPFWVQSASPDETTEITSSVPPTIISAGPPESPWQVFFGLDGVVKFQNPCELTSPMVLLTFILVPLEFGL
jgi:hypothetical protein